MEDLLASFKPLLEGIGVDPELYPVLLCVGIVNEFLYYSFDAWKRQHSAGLALAMALAFGIASWIEHALLPTAGMTKVVVLFAAAALAEAGASKLPFFKKAAPPPTPPTTNQGGFMRFKLSLFLLAVLGLLAIALMVSPSHAQTTSAPLLSWQRVSVGVSADFTSYRPSLLGVRQEFRAVLPVSYNLGKHLSLTGRVARGFTTTQVEWSAGVTLHLLARGKVVTP